MVVEDRLYGSTQVNEPVFPELINSHSVQRLKKVSQFGIPDKYSSHKSFSRYEHSVGVFLLLRKLGASEEEQIAGLLHDVSHAAFSHLYDWVLEDQTSLNHHESHQDLRHLDFIKRSELPQILEKYGYQVERIADHHNFGLLERPIPDLCADRVDYSLREFSPGTAGNILTNLTTLNNQIVCRDQNTAALFGREFLKLQTNHWGSLETMSLFRYMASVLRKALKKEVIQESDFWTDDEVLFTKLKKLNDPEIKQDLEVLQNFDKHPGFGVRIFKKFRYIDPPFIEGGELVKLTSRDREYKMIINEAKKDHQKGFLI